MKPQMKFLTLASTLIILSSSALALDTSLAGKCLAVTVVVNELVGEEAAEEFNRKGTAIFDAAIRNGVVELVKANTERHLRLFPGADASEEERMEWMRDKYDACEQI